MKVLIKVKSVSHPGESHSVDISDESGALIVFCHCDAHQRLSWCHHKESLLQGDVTALADLCQESDLRQVLSTAAFRALRPRFKKFLSKKNELDGKLAPLEERRKALVLEFGRQLVPTTASARKMDTIRAKKGRSVDFWEQSGSLRISCNCESGVAEKMCWHKVQLLKGDYDILEGLSQGARLDKLLSSREYRAIRHRFEQYVSDMEVIVRELKPLQNCRTELRDGFTYELAFGRGKKRPAKRAPQRR